MILLAGTALAGCVLPAPPAAAPDGRMATRAQMIAAHVQTALQLQRGHQHVYCLPGYCADPVRARDGRRPADAGERDLTAMHDRMHNAAIDADQAVANKFNQQLRIYKARGDAMLETAAYAAATAAKPLAPLTIERRDPRAEDVLIEILYCGVCHSDIHQARDEWGTRQSSRWCRATRSSAA